MFQSWVDTAWGLLRALKGVTRPKATLIVCM